MKVVPEIADLKAVAISSLVKDGSLYSKLSILVYPRLKVMKMYLVNSMLFQVPTGTDYLITVYTYETKIIYFQAQDFGL